MVIPPQYSPNYNFGFPNGDGLKYFLFRFADGSVPGGYDYGYISVNISGSAWDTGAVQVNSVVYDDTGAQIEAGDPATAAPEPSTLALAALALGAAAIAKRKRAA